MGENSDDAENDRLVDWARPNEGQKVTASLKGITENNGRREGEGGSAGGERERRGGRVGVEVRWRSRR